MYVALSARKANGEFFTGTDLYLVLDLGALGIKLCEVFMNYHLKSRNDTLCDLLGKKLNFSLKMDSLKISFIFRVEVPK